MAGVSPPLVALPAPYQLLPPLSVEEYEALKADIRARGVQVPIERDDDGNVLDGHHRLQIIAELGLTDYPVIVRHGWTEAQKRDHVLALNLHRRHLTREQRRAVVQQLRSVGWSGPRIATALHVDEKTVRLDLAGSDYSEPAAVTGRDGKTYPARKPAKSHREAHAERLAAYQAAASAAGAGAAPGATPTYDAIVRGEALTYLRTVPDGCVHLCIISPPYWAKREYTGDPRELGREPDPNAYVARLVAIVNEIGRVLAPGGYLFLNLGDTYASQPGQHRGDPERRRGVSDSAIQASATALAGRELDVAEKSLAGIPWRVLLALTLDHGWRCANVIPWVKRNPLRENVYDRLRQQWEPILVLTRSHHAYLDDARVREVGATDVWELPVGRRGAARGHYAPFPDALVERAITLACPPAGVVLDVFAGSGTVRDVAVRMGRRFLGCDLEPMVREEVAGHGNPVPA